MWIRYWIPKVIVEKSKMYCQSDSNLCENVLRTYIHVLISRSFAILDGAAIEDRFSSCLLAMNNYLLSNQPSP